MPPTRFAFGRVSKDWFTCELHHEYHAGASKTCAEQLEDAGENCFPFASGEFLAQTSTHTFPSGSFLHAAHSHKRLKVRSMCTPANDYVRFLTERSKHALPSFGQHGPGTSHIKHQRKRLTLNPHRLESTTCLSLPQPVVRFIHRLIVGCTALALCAPPRAYCLIKDHRVWRVLFDSSEGLIAQLQFGFNIEETPGIPSDAAQYVASSRAGRSSISHDSDWQE